MNLWSHSNGRGCFSLEVGRLEPFPIRIVWNAWVAPKVSFFAWEAT